MDEALLEQFQRAAFGYFLDEFNPANGLVADTTRPGAPASIAVVGFMLAAYPVAVERGWITRADAVARTLTTLRFFWNSAQSGAPDATGYKGFYYHFLDMKSGKRVWESEISLVDSAFFVAGALTTSVYFSEPEIRELADALYRRMDWRWAQDGKPFVAQGWKPESGFLHYGWEGYDEAAILYVLGLASPTHPLADHSFSVWTETYQWEHFYGYDFLYSGPLFTHQFSHAWIDFRAIQDRFMQEAGSDYFENSRTAIHIQREYARRNPHEFEGYGENCWGFTASHGPGNRIARVHGKAFNVFSYAARGVPFGPDDGTISPSASLASLPFEPELSMSALRHICERYPEVAVGQRLRNAFNPTLKWISEGYFGLDQGIVVLMVENYRSQLIWNLMRQCPYIKNGLLRAGFRNGWL